MEETISKGIILSFGAVAGYLLQCVSPLIIAYCFITVLDYISGTAASLLEEKWSQKKGIKGLVRKIGTFILMTVSCLLDYIISTQCKGLGVDFNTQGSIASACTMYLIGIEGISLLQNLKRLGVPVPSFIENVFKKFKQKN